MNASIMIYPTWEGVCAYRGLFTSLRYNFGTHVLGTILDYNGQYLWVTLVAQYRVTSVYFIAVYHECVMRKGSKNTPNFDCNVV